MQRRFCVPLVLILAVLALPGAADQKADSQIRADVETYLRSLKAAYEADDRAKVMSLFQYGDLVAPTEREYAMFGQMRFWDKPIKEIQTKDGVIRVTFTMDPQSDSPAQFLTVEMIRDSTGKLMMKSSMTPEQIAAAKEKKKLEAESERELAGLVREIDGRKRIQEWPLLDGFLEEMARRYGPMPEGVGVFPLAEWYRGDDAVLLSCVGEAGQLRDPRAMHFKKSGGTWAPVEGPRSRVEAEKLMESRAPDVRVIRRQSGLSLDQMPLFLLYLVRDQPRKFREAQNQSDFKRCASILDDMLIGFSLTNASDLLEALQRRARSVQKVTLASKRSQTDGRLLAAFDIEDEDGSRKISYFLAKEGSGWVIDESYSLRARKTLGLIRMLATAVEAYGIDHDGLYPQANSVKELKPLIEPTYIGETPTTDAWGTPFRYEVSKDRKSYRLLSAGDDQKFDSKSWGVSNQDLVDLAADLVFANGTFVRMWRVSD
jgi:hypothetical protein